MKNSDLRSFYIAPPQLSKDDIASCPIPDFTFLRIDQFSSFDCSQDEKQSSERHKSPRHLIMGDVLTALNGQKNYLAYACIGNQTRVDHYMGISLLQPPENMDQQDLGEISYELQKYLLSSFFSQIEIHEQAFSHLEVLNLLAPLAVNVGIVTGMPSSRSEFGSAGSKIWEQALRGRDFGILVLAAPTPHVQVSNEEQIILERIEEALRTHSSGTKHRIKFFLELQNAYLQQLQLGQAIGQWQVGMYFLAPKTDTFVRLQSLIRATYDEGNTKPTRLHTLTSKALKEHLLNFGLLQNTRIVSSRHRLFGYEFLTPLNSRMLSAYIPIFQFKNE